MASFDINAAKKAGYSDSEIASFLGQKNGFDVDGARNAGYSDADILGKLTEQPKATAMDRANSVATGVNRGAVTRTLGLPVDTVQNVIDLGKAGVGTVATMFGRPDLAPDINSNRSGVVGSGDWIEQKLRNAGGGAIIDPTGPDDATSRVLHATGMGAGGALAGGKMVKPAPIGPNARGVEARNIALGAAGGASGGVAIENGADPAMAILASMGPQALAMGAPAGIKAAVRGGEQGRQVMAQRIQDFKNGGVENPSVGLASNNRLLQGVENLLANTPGAVGRMEAAREAMIGGMQNKAGQVRDQASTRYGADVSGRMIQSDLVKLLKPRITEGYELQTNKLASMLPPDERFPITNSLAALNGATSANPLAPATTGSFVQPRINTLRNNMLADTAAPAPVLFNQPAPNKGLPMSALKEIRTSIGKEAASNAIIGTPEQADWKGIYAGLSQDMRNAARTTDMQAGPQLNNKGPAERTLDRSNRLYSAGMDRIDQVQPFANKAAPEQAYTSLIQSGKENVSTLRAVKKSIGEDARASTAATYIDRLGRANPGNQNDLGDAWSPDRFLTNWNTLNPKARRELFSGFKGSDKVATSMDDIAKAAAMLKDSSKVWANPSGTGANVAARIAIGATAFGTFFSPVAAAGAASIMGGANLGARLMTNPKAVAWLAESTKLPKSQAVAHINRLIIMANESKDPEFKKDVGAFVDSLAE